MSTNTICIGKGTLHSLNLYTYEENSSILSTQNPFQNLHIFTQHIIKISAPYSAHCPVV
jgi:hypothetical protein